MTLLRYWPILPVAICAAVALDLSDTPLGASVRKHLGWNVIAAQQPHSAGTICTPGGEIAGTIRNDGDGWYVLDDADHRPINIAGVETNLFAIKVRFAFKGRLVRTFIAVPDTPLATAGFFMGAGVGLNDADITIARAGWFGPHRVSPTLVTTKTYPLSNIWIYGKVDGDC